MQCYCTPLESVSFGVSGRVFQTPSFSRFYETCDRWRVDQIPDKTVGAPVIYAKRLVWWSRPELSYTPPPIRSFSRYFPITGYSYCKLHQVA